MLPDASQQLASQLQPPLTYATCAAAVYRRALCSTATSSHSQRHHHHCTRQLAPTPGLPQALPAGTAAAAPAAAAGNQSLAEEHSALACWRCPWLPLLAGTPGTRRHKPSALACLLAPQLLLLLLAFAPQTLRDGASLLKAPTPSARACCCHCCCHCLKLH